MPYKLTLTLKELNQMALGSPQMQHMNVNILHTLLAVLLKKLNCADEEVTVEGFESRDLHEILANANVPVIPLGDEQVKLVQPRIEQIDELAGRLATLTEKVECHLKKVEDAKLHETVDFDAELERIYHEKYPTGNEDLCTACDSDCEIACSLLQNVGFLNKLMRRICFPAIDRIFVLEDKIEQTDKQLESFIAKIKEEYGKLAVVLGCLKEIDQLQTTVHSNRALFLATMEEVQEMMDSKLDKINIPQLKSYIRSKLQHIETELQVIQSQSDCPKAAGIIMQGVACMSCGSQKVCAEVDIDHVGALPNWNVKKAPKKSRPCNCNERRAYNETRQFLAVNFRKSQRFCSINAQIAGKGRHGCRDNDQMEFITGTDGHYYRKGKYAEGEDEPTPKCLK